MELNDILKVATQKKASDIHLKVALPPIFRINGALIPFKGVDRLTPEEVSRLVFSTMTTSQKDKFKSTNEIDLAYGVPGLGRFRVNVFQQRGTLGAVLRVIPIQIKNPSELFLPDVIEKKIATQQRGLILVTGTTGSGKSTTLAAIIDQINSQRTAHIMTIEDPVEFLHRDKRSIVNQREVGFDTVDFATALRSSLRQDPDVILVGEMRDLETIEIALTAAETGHLVLSTLHTIDAQETINRIVGAFPPNFQNQTRISLAAVLRGIISQRLVQKSDGKGRVPAVEVLVTTARIRDCIINKEKSSGIMEAINSGFTTYGMQTFDQSLMSLFQKKLITYEEAYKHASNPADFALKMKGISSTSDLNWDTFAEGEDSKDESDESIDIERF